MAKDLFQQTINCIIDYAKDQALTNNQEHASDEVVTRLKQLQTAYNEALDLNDQILHESLVLTESNRIMNDFLKKNFKRAVVGNKSHMVAVDLTKLDEIDFVNTEKVNVLHGITESIYNDLWTIRQRLKYLPKFKNFNPPGVRNVRNHLMLHTEDQYSVALPYSFGISTNGPVLRPAKPSNIEASNDAGLCKNVEEFLTSIIFVLEPDRKTK